MKKIVLSILGLMLGGAVLTGCSGSEEPMEQKTYTPEGQVSGIHLQAEDREIEVSLSQDGQVHLSYGENSKEYYEISLSEEKVLTVTSKTKKSWTDYIGVQSSEEGRTILLQVPDGVLETLTLSTTNEDISLPELSVTGTASISANGGDISFDGLGVGSSLTLNVKNGDISGTVLGSYEEFAIESQVKKGESSLPEQKDGGDKALQVSGNNGDVEIEFAGVS